MTDEQKHTKAMVLWDTLLRDGVANLEDVRAAFGLAEHMDMSSFGVLRISWGVDLATVKGRSRYVIHELHHTLTRLREYALWDQDPALRVSVRAACEIADTALTLIALEREP